ncbi:MAG TPA: TonB family protein [Paludibacteraceae bacterium]|jgi:TonB family protein|nr:TonB family protein [Paludibacteraceae bacterium]HQB68534.1 TonB family protein [Paludibacteraceae bacterium]HRS67035.1 TonB family protein [Paludibacteraceae bacterium]
MKKSELYASIGTVVVCGIVLAILLLFGFSVSKKNIDEGLMVSFGEEIEGFGQSELADPTISAEPAVSDVSTPDDEDLMTQEDESVVLAAQEKEKKRKEEERQRLLEEQRRLEEQRIAAENQRKIDQAKTAAGVFGKPSGSGSGSTVGDAMQGNPAGSGSSGGHSWSLAGRSLSGGLPKPAYSGQQEGRVVVKIRVDRAGNVTDVSIDPVSNISDKELRDASLQAAKRTKFTPGSDVAIGTITYQFRLN